MDYKQIRLAFDNNLATKPNIWIIYVDQVNDEEINIDTIYGVHTLLNLTLFDMYYRIMNGST